MRHLLIVVPIVVLSLLSCGSPTAPSPTVQGAPVASALLAPGRWSTGSACMNVTESMADLHAGCWHGRFARPRLSGGSFTIEGTYRFEAGPEKDETGANARFIGSITGDTLTLRVERADPSSQPLTYVLELGEGSCQPLCV